MLFVSLHRQLQNVDAIVQSKTKTVCLLFKKLVQRSPSPPRQSGSTSKRRRHKDGGDSGRHICEICNCDVETAKRLYGVLDNCDHVL